MWRRLQVIYQCNKGITLVETLIAILLLSFILFPLFISFTTASQLNTKAEERGLSSHYAIGKMEEMLAMNLSDIPLSSPSGAPVPSPVSDSVTIQGKTVNRNVYVDLSDGDGDLIPDAGLKRITVTVGDVSVNTLKANYTYATF